MINTPKVSQLLANKEGTKNLVKLSGKFYEMSTLSPIKNMGKIFNIDRAVLNILVVGPLENDIVVGGKEYYTMFLFRDHQSNHGNELDNITNIVNRTKSRGTYNSELTSHFEDSHDDFSKSFYAANLDSKISIIACSKNNSLAEFCETVTKNIDPCIDGIVLMNNTVNNLSSPFALSTRDYGDEFLDSTVFS